MGSIVYYPSKGSTILPVSGIVLYFHPTTFGKWNGPSIHNSAYWQGLGAFYASQNLALLVPDLIGFGNDNLPHPYVLYP